ncbi:MAG: helix-turn-helix domain-containing protein [Eggerthellaceae bacterium]|nr:helix-turn-helix domain-containing protein [Eggerthellaceae bacterium]
MQLNADIVFDNLPAEFNASISGTKTFDLTLRRPELYEGGGAPFLANRLFLAIGDRLPQRARAERGSVIVCIGDSPWLDRYRQRCCVIVVSSQMDFYRVFNSIQHIFDFYDEWEAELNGILEADGSVEELLDCSESVFGNPLYAIDKDFRMLGMSKLASGLDANPTVRPADNGSLRVGAFDQFLEMHDLSMTEREPFVLSLLDQTTLNCNLHESDQYAGCLIVHYIRRTYRPSDKPLAKFLSQKLLTAMRQLAANAPEGLGSVRQALQNLVEERPLDAIERDVLDRANSGGPFVCLRMKLSNQLEQLPLGYVRNALETAFARGFAFEFHRNSVVAVIDTSTLDSDDYREAIAKGIAPFTGSMEMKAGVSNLYGNLIDTRALFKQADSALDIGMLFDPDYRIYHFDDYALREMAMNAIGDMPLDTLLPPGLQKLVEHDAASSTSYIETLRSYLNNNMSVAKTAADLFVHRSTLIERLTRLRRDLEVDLDDPDERLKLALLLKAMQTRDELRSGRNAV